LGLDNLEERKMCGALIIAIGFGILAILIGGFVIFWTLKGLKGDFD
jgi:hypothetical protein